VHTIKQNTIFSAITIPLGGELMWRWEDKHSILLTECSWARKERILTNSPQLFSEEWHKKNIKKAHQALKDVLSKLINPNKNQLIFTQPAFQETSALAVIWWPWSYGSTYSIRIEILNSNYDDAMLKQGQASLISNIFQRIISA
jgi:hypothetical protein